MNFRITKKFDQFAANDVRYLMITLKKLVFELVLLHAPEELAIQVENDRTATTL